MLIFAPEEAELLLCGRSISSTRRLTAVLADFTTGQLELLIELLWQEGELLLGPNTVTRASEAAKEEDGWSVLRMVEDAQHRKFYS